MPYIFCRFMRSQETRNTLKSLCPLYKVILLFCLSSWFRLVQKHQMQQIQHEFHSLSPTHTQNCVCFEGVFGLEAYCWFSSSVCFLRAHQGPNAVLVRSSAGHWPALPLTLFFISFFLRLQLFCIVHAWGWCHCGVRDLQLPMKDLDWRCWRLWQQIGS